MDLKNISEKISNFFRTHRTSLNNRQNEGEKSFYQKCGVDGLHNNKNFSHVVNHSFSRSLVLLLNLFLYILCATFWGTKCDSPSRKKYYWYLRVKFSDLPQALILCWKMVIFQRLETIDISSQTIDLEIGEKTYLNVFNRAMKYHESQEFI